MTRNPTIIHLANVLAIAEADGTFSEPENGALQDILCRIGADDADLDAARDLLEREQPYRLQAFRDPAENMQMIENMVLVALADGHVSPSASRPLDAFLSSLGFVQADMDMIVQRVRSRLRTIQTPQARPASPSTRQPENVRLVVRHGRSDEATPPPVDRYPAAKAAPKPPPLPPQQAKARPLPPVQTQPEPEAAAFVPEPAPAPRGAATQAPADTPVVGCALRRDASPDGACYCFGRPEGPLNPWGCRQTTGRRAG